MIQMFMNESFYGGNRREGESLLCVVDGTQLLLQLLFLLPTVKKTLRSKYKQFELS